ncbi:glycosyltransferase [Advenella kashmirensis]
MTPSIPFSLLMAVYKNDSPDFLAQALDSVVANTCQPTQVVVVKDGPVTPALDRVLEQYSERLALDLVSLPVNQGLGPALHAGVLACTEEWIARFDSDDICSATRFAEQLAYIASHPEISLLGGQIREFESHREDAYASRIVPVGQAAIYRFAKARNPFNHMTVMFRKSAVLAAGNYQNDPLYEDYALWIRMIMQARTVANLPAVLVYARAGNNMFRRRGGWKYAWNEVRFQYGFYRKGFLSLPQLAVNIASRVPVRLVPNRARAFIYRHVLRRPNQ